VTSQSSYLLAYEEVVPSATGFQTIDRSGKITGTPERAYPKLKSALGITWLYPQLELTLRTRYIHSMKESCRDLSAFPGTCSNPNPGNDALSTNKLHITVYNDLQAMWFPAFERRLSVTAGVNNLFNRNPPNCYSCSLNGFNGATYDVPGMFGYLSATYHLQ
jgi:iron complex outermembrane receptor protein